MAAKTPRGNPVDRYAWDVIEGRVVAGRLAKLACERHIKDLDTGPLRGLRFNAVAAVHAIEFFRFLKHFEGRWAGREIVLEPWQEFRIGAVFGWQRYDEDEQAWVRRFRIAYHEVARKNGKSLEGAGVGLYLLDADGEPGAQVYSAATKFKQARIVWDGGAELVRNSPALRSRIRVLPGKANMHVLETASKWEAVAASVQKQDGFNPHGAIIDELHAHRTREIWDVFTSALGARLQPLLWSITTAGFDQTGVCFEERGYTIQVLEGTVEDDSRFGYIATLDEGDDWEDERVWIKSNPNLDVSVGRTGLRDEAKKAAVLPSALNSFLTKNLNVWTQQQTRWISLPLWAENGAHLSPTEDELKGRACFGGLDLGAVSDLAAWVLVFPHDEDTETIDVLCRFWCPESRLHDQENPYAKQYQGWQRQGFLTATQGNATDFAFIRKQVLDDAAKFRLVDLNIDRLFQAHQLAMELADELGESKVVGMGQGFYSMAAPAKEFERRLLLKKIRHGGNPVLRWMAGNAAAKQDPSGSVKPDKSKSQGKIDGIVALVMALDRAMRHTVGTQQKRAGISRL